MGDIGDGEQALRALLARAGQGDELAFEDFYRRTAQQMLQRARPVVSEAQLEDFLMRLYMRAWAGASGYDPQAGEPTTWLWSLGGS